MESAGWNGELNRDGGSVADKGTVAERGEGPTAVWEAEAV
jgi:hypothetical protein